MSGLLRQACDSGSNGFSFSKKEKTEGISKNIVFVSDRDENYEIYVMDVDGKNQRNLTNSPGWDDLWPRWAPTSSGQPVNPPVEGGKLATTWGAIK